MATYAVISGNIVSNTIIADNKETTEKVLNLVLVELEPENPAGIGWTYDEDTATFSPPVIEITEE